MSFGIIVLNGEPFTRYCLRALYPFAHEIIVVEGAAPAAAGIATPGGHSTDSTLDTINRFKSQEDPENKVRLVVRDGFWSEKDEQSQAYAERATGDYLWQVDIDEFYRPDDMRQVLDMLAQDPGITAVSFKQIAFWGGFDYITDGWYLRRGADIFHRLFKWGPGYRYAAHRPPTVLDAEGRDMRQVKWIGGREMARRGVFLYHYCLVFPKQVLNKWSYYTRADWATFAGPKEDWAQRHFLLLEHPFRVHNEYHHPSWLERFRSEHPPVVAELIADLAAGRLQIEARQDDDVEKLLRSKWYSLGRFVLKTLAPLDALGASAARSLRQAAFRLRHSLQANRREHG